ncbi:hypothetical protein AVEN_30352-1 [Araneus ventricosus]|uniref:Uncharacterized protein n=1 Tax=Araneus ventricosus TaxID=182803 RepID=A0A4Y2MVE0_ARAVE|nr:hypothetical protein AVEN_30352-1 [Araneus ventricosus]
MDEEDQKITFQKNPPEVLRASWIGPGHQLKLALPHVRLEEKRLLYGNVGIVDYEVRRDYDYIELLKNSGTINAFKRMREGT